MFVEASVSCKEFGLGINEGKTAVADRSARV